ncbi:hypothetical protein NLI96_g7832 [Meripilus lineatus]|uniref:Kinase n=1 Tax=Meripilus lineatus TaxID=2056292 RepID=A0AAD5V0C5_9APHY|nr:hypothetical protein NLI96_g7832 [Physisporinus lineatus]
MTQDKYKGREVRTEDFPSVLSSFLHDGERLLAYQIPHILRKLYALAKIINRLKGFRFYGCSLLMIYDGDREAQDVFRGASAMENPCSRSKRGESLERTRDSQTHSRLEELGVVMDSGMSIRSGSGGVVGGQGRRPTLRRSHSEDLLVGPVANRSSRRKKRGEVQIRIVDFAHTTTGRDWLGLPPGLAGSVEGIGYEGDVDPETGLLYARFPPHYPDEPDRGFLFGLMKLAETLEKIWYDERKRRMKMSRDGTPVIGAGGVVLEQLAPLSVEGKEIFDEIFATSEGEEDLGMIST